MLAWLFHYSKFALLLLTVTIALTTIWLRRRARQAGLPPEQYPPRSLKAATLALELTAFLLFVRLIIGFYH